MVWKSYNQINLRLSYDEIMLFNQQKPPKVANTCSYSNEGGLFQVKYSQ